MYIRKCRDTREARGEPATSQDDPTPIRKQNEAGRFRPASFVSALRRSRCWQERQRRWNFVLITPMRSLAMRMCAAAAGWTPSIEKYCPNGA